MVAIALTVIVCAVTVEAAAGGPETVRSCEVYNETRPMADLEPCQHRSTRDLLGREALKRAGRQLEPLESVDTTCRMMLGGGLPTG